MPLLVVFLAVSLPLPWLINVLAQRNAMLKAHILKRREVHIDISIELARDGGAGKSTVLACIGGIEQPDAANVQFGNAQFFPPSMTLHKRRVGFLTQDPGLFPISASVRT
jgi:ABC-type sulfate/molybdate transport systems ATPase subunit